MYYLGIDLGATSVRTVIGDETGTVLGETTVPTPPGPTGGDVTAAILDTVREVCSRADVTPTRIEAAGIGAAGRLDSDAGSVSGHANLPDSVTEIPLVSPVTDLIDSDDVFLQKDVNAGVVGERFYTDDSVDNIVYLTISSGIGAGIAIDGEIISGWNGNAGEVGHTVVDATGFMTCGCGRDGHWEAYCSGENLPRYARTLQENLDIETSLPIGNTEFTAVDIFAHAGEDALADEILDRMSEWNLIGLANLVHTYAPSVVRIGGAVAVNNPEHVVEPLASRLEERLLVDMPAVSLTTLGEDTVVKGALASAITHSQGGND